MDCLISPFTPEYLLPEKRRDSLVDQIFNGKYHHRQNLINMS